MHCSNCGNNVFRGDEYCRKCGAKLIWKNNVRNNSLDVNSEDKRQLEGQQKQKSYKWYFILVIIFAIYGVLIETILATFATFWQVLSFFFAGPTLVWIILSIIMLIIFIVNKLPKVYIVLPIWYLAAYTILIMIALTAEIFSLGIGIENPLTSNLTWGIFYAIITGIFEIGYAIFMLTRKQS